MGTFSFKPPHREKDGLKEREVGESVSSCMFCVGFLFGRKIKRNLKSCTPKIKVSWPLNRTQGMEF